jgi:hypothetical protein
MMHPQDLRVERGEPAASQKPLRLAQQARVLLLTQAAREWPARHLRTAVLEWPALLLRRAALERPATRLRMVAQEGLPMLPLTAALERRATHLRTVAPVMFQQLSSEQVQLGLAGLRPVHEQALRRRRALQAPGERRREPGRCLKMHGEDSFR